MAEKVYIVGAGAGGLDFITLKAYRLISEIADVVIYDRLISEEIINAINPKAKKIFAGKEPKLHHMTQDEINEAIVTHANNDEIVVRLKGGDPFIFGRGGEEINQLKKYNIDYEVVPGITSASLAAAQLALPLTYRNVADGVVFVSGHSYSEESPNLDWKSLATGKNTIVVYMGIGNIYSIAQKLVENGMSEGTPCAVVQNVGFENSKSIKTSLKSIGNDIINAGIENPAIIIIGNVVQN